MANLQLAVHSHQPQLVTVDKSSKKAKEVDDTRRDEWSTGAVNSLLHAYEAKWNQRNRRNLKGGDWEDVAIIVSARSEGTKSAKTPFQCKNKVASMKQKYRSEALLKGINGSVSSRWPFFGRMDHMFRVTTREEENTPRFASIGVGGMQVAVMDIKLREAVPQIESRDSVQEIMRTEQQGIFQAGLPQQKLEFQGGVAQVHVTSQEDASNTLPQRKENAAQETDTSTPRSKAVHMPGVYKKPKSKHKKHHLIREVAASILQFADSILKLEEAKMEMFKDSERMRAELEARRVNMELQRTEIIMNTQLQIAKILSTKSQKKKVDIPAPSMSASPSNSLLPAAQNSPHGHPMQQSTLSTNANQSIPAISQDAVPALVQHLYNGIKTSQS